MFLHGLDGNPQTSWGYEGSPAALPRRLHTLLPELDLYLLDYPCRLARFAADSVLEVSVLGEQWAALLQVELMPRYRHLVLIMHCLGGMVMGDAIRRLDTHVPEIDSVWIDVPLTPPSRTPEPRIARIMVALGMNEEQIQDNLRATRQAAMQGRLRTMSVASTRSSWIDPFNPLALQDGGDGYHRLPAEHADLARAKAAGPCELTDLIGAFATRRRQT